MNARRPSHRTANTTGLATSAGALVALVALAAVMSSLPGAQVRATMLEGRVGVAETPSVREVAAAVAAAARELVGGERITATIHAGYFSNELAASDPGLFIGFETADLVLSRLIAEQFLDLPPPAC